MRILIDTNVIMDLILKREPFFCASKKVIELCANNNIQGCIAAHTVPNLYFILRKHLTIGQRKDILLKLCKMFTVVGIDAEKLEAALQNNDFDDFEDCLQVECAKDFESDYIITRNIKDFNGSVVTVIEPSEFIKKFI